MRFLAVCPPEHVARMLGGCSKHPSGRWTHDRRLQRCKGQFDNGQHQSSPAPAGFNYRWLWSVSAMLWATIISIRIYVGGIRGRCAATSIQDCWTAHELSLCKTTARNSPVLGPTFDATVERAQHGNRLRPALEAGSRRSPLFLNREVPLGVIPGSVHFTDYYRDKSQCYKANKRLYVIYKN
jgi:hypothetical protein